MPTVQLTDLQGAAPRARALITAALTERLGPVECTFDFHREWNGGWRCRVDVSGRGRLEFVLFETAPDVLLALPHPLPARWADARGFAAEDGSRWSFDHEGQVLRMADDARLRADGAPPR
jgi:hypothetical protein